MIEKHLKAAGSPGVEVDLSKLIWTPYNAEKEYANFKDDEKGARGRDEKRIRVDGFETPFACLRRAVRVDDPKE